MSIIYRQYDSRWGSLSYPAGNTMAGSGCGPTSCANVIANISNSSITPKDTRTYMLNHGYAVKNQGTAWAGIPACLKNWGYNVIQCATMKDVWNYAANGYKQGVILFRSGTKGGVTWTTGGHFVAFTDYKIENGKHYLYTRDSGSRKNDGWHAYETTMQGLIPAIWVCVHSSSRPVTCTITYNANGGSGAPGKQSYTYANSGTTTLSATKPTRSGYTFLGWSLDKTATSAKYTAGQKWNLNNKGNYTLYAVWRGNNLITINYNANGGTGAPSKTTYYYNTNGATKLSATKPTRSGYTFLGWALQAGATKAAYPAGSAWSLKNGGINNAYTLYAVWQKNPTKKAYTGTYPSGTIKNGSRGNQVSYLQKYLNWYYGKTVLVIDGICGPNTVSYIKSFQKANGLTADGIVGPKTIAKMKTIKK